MEKTPVILDVDTGIDDAIAIIHALASKDLNVLGISTVAGNQTVDKTTHNTLALVDFLGRAQVPVAMGAAAPLLAPLHTADEVHGADGLGGAYLPASNKHPEAQDAVACLRTWLEASPTPATIIAVAPLTNIALLLLACPDLKPKIARIVLMGGGAFRGNVTPVSEANIFSDPEAAAIVFGAGVPITMCGLDVTMQAFTTDTDIARFAALGNETGRFCAQALRFYSGFYRKKGGCVGGCVIHDAVAVMVLTHPELLRGEKAFVTVDLVGQYTRGCTTTDFRSRNCAGEKNATVMMELLDREKFVNLLLASAASFS